MKLNIFTKLFLVLLLSMVVLLSAVFASILWTFQHGFVEYLRAVEENRLNIITTRLENSFSEHGSWDFLKANERGWLGIMDALVDREQEPLPPRLPEDRPSGLPPNSASDANALPPFPGRDEHRGHRGPPPPVHDPLFPFGHLRLLDVDKNHIAGPRSFPGPERLLAIRKNATIVGWLAIGQNRMVTDKLADTFIQQQKHASFAIASLALLLAIAAAIALAGQFVRPIRDLANGVQAMGQGRFDTVINVHSHDELGQLAADMNLLALTLKRNEHQRRLWITDFSHELRTPLAVLRSEIEALQEGIRSPSPERIDSLHNEVVSLGNLIDDLYQLSLSDIGAMQYCKEPLNLVPLLKNALNAFRPRFAERRINLGDLPDAPSSAIIVGDQKRLGQLFNNLLENSCRYTDAGGCCEVTMQARSGSFHLHILDSEPAVPEADFGRIFERFYRVDDSRRREVTGAGFGLALCKNIVEAHGGTIEAARSKLGGVDISITLPLAHL